MYHSVYFGDINTYDDWHLVPKSRPSFNMPSVKTQTIELPGADGEIDLTQALTGYTTYGNRTGSWDFYVLNGYGEWYDRYSEIASYLHGQKFKCVLEDDIAFYYEGRFTLGNWKSDKDWSTITIEYNVAPYKMSRQTTTEDWLWDPFNFQNGIIQEQYLKNLTVDSQTRVTWDYTDIAGRKPCIPTFKVENSDAGLSIYLKNEELGIEVEKKFENGTNTDTNYIFSNYSPTNVLTLGATGKGTLSVDFRIGRL